MKSILCYRFYESFSGGHQKVADYFNYLYLATSFSPFLCLENTQEEPIPLWQTLPEDVFVSFIPSNYDYLFLAGLDWLQYEKAGINPSKPVINLIQSVRHADPSNELYKFLSHKAIRICVSPEVAQAIKATGKVNGPVFTISNGIHIPLAPQLNKKNDVLIVGVKNPTMARSIKNAIKSSVNEGGVCLLDTWLPRQELLTHMAESRTVILLPYKDEGFYLPALEAMQLADLVIVPDCIGNRSFCLEGYNCLRPDYSVNSICDVFKQAQILLSNEAAINELKQHAKQTVAEHSLEREQKEFLHIMNRIDALWQK